MHLGMKKTSGDKLSGGYSIHMNILMSLKILFVKSGDFVERNYIDLII